MTDNTELIIATGASHKRIVNGRIELFRLDQKSRQWQIGRLVNEQVVWSWWPHDRLPESSEPL